MENIVCTLPAKPQKEIGIPLKIGPTLMSYIGECLKCNRVLTVNILNTYNNKEQYLQKYLEILKQDEINYEFLMIDKDNLKKILPRIENMIEKNIITESIEQVIRCDCGKVDILKKVINYNNDGEMYYIKNGEVYCKCCNSKCVESKEKILKIDVEKDKLSELKIAPLYLKGVVNGIEKEMINSFILVSKKRNTGCTINYHGTEYNIDIDFIWKMLLQCFEANKKICVAGNRQIMKMFDINYINNLTEKQDILFVGHPHIYMDECELNRCHFDEDDDKIIQKITILCNLKWKKNNCHFTSSIYKYLKNMEPLERLEFYNRLVEDFDASKQNGNSFEENLERCLLNSSNFQENIKRLKK